MSWIAARLGRTYLPTIGGIVQMLASNLNAVQYSHKPTDSEALGSEQTVRIPWRDWICILQRFGDEPALFARCLGAIRLCEVKLHFLSQTQATTDEEGRGNRMGRIAAVAKFLSFRLSLISVNAQCDSCCIDTDVSFLATRRGVM